MKHLLLGALPGALLALVLLAVVNNVGVMAKAKNLLNGTKAA